MIQQLDGDVAVVKVTRGNCTRGISLDLRMMITLGSEKTTGQNADLADNRLWMDHALR